MKKTIFLILCLFAFSFAEESASIRYDGPLYTLNTPGHLDYILVNPYMEFTETFQISVDPAVTVIYAGSGGSRSDLGAGAIVCEGPLTATLTPDGTWATGGHLDQAADIYQPAPPENTGGVRANRAIRWNQGDYDDLIGEEVCSRGESCWGSEGSLVTQPADYEDTGGVWYYNRDSGATVICKGTSELRQGSTLLVSRSIDLGAATNTITAARGNYVFSGQMNVNGCLSVLRYPDSTTPGYTPKEKVYGRTEAVYGPTPGPVYSDVVGPATISVRVVNNGDLRCSADIFSVTPSPINITPGGSAHVTIRITNTCPASDPLCRPINVSNLRVTTSGFRYVPDLTISLPGPLGGGSTTSHRVTARPGETITFSGTVIAPNDPGICEDLHGTIEFAADYQCPGCEGSTGGSPLTGTADITVPYECPPPDINLTRDVNLVPRFDPDPGSTLTFRTGERPNISIMTWNRGMNFSNPGETCIVICGPGDDSCSDPVAEYRYTYPALGPLEEFGDELNFVCSEEDERKTFDLFVGVDCTNTTNETSEIDNSDQRRIYCAPPTNETGDNETYSCDLTPAGPSPGRAGETYEFDLDSCTKLGEAYDCISAVNVDWRFARSGNATYTHEEGNDLGASFVMGTDSRGEGNVRVTARVDFGDGNATCSSDVYMPLVPCIDFV